MGLMENIRGVLVAVLLLQCSIVCQKLIGGHINNENGAEARIHFPDEKNQIVAAYNLPDEIFNNGKPFYVDKDPETGRPDFSTKRTSEIEDKLPETAQELRLSNINQLTPNFHDYLNLPTKYNPEKFLYPIVSSSYANMKIQGNTQRNHSLNHKLDTKSYSTTIASPTTTTTTTTRTTTTSRSSSSSTTTKKPISLIEQLFESFVNDDEETEKGETEVTTIVNSTTPKLESGVVATTTTTTVIEDIKEEPVTVKAYTVKSTTEVASASPNVVLAIPSNAVVVEIENTNNSVSNDDDIITKSDESPVKFHGISSQGVINVAPGQDTVSLVIGNNNNNNLIDSVPAILPPNNYINRRIDVATITTSSQRPTVENDADILALNSKPFVHQLQPSSDLKPPELANKFWNTKSIIVPANVFIEQRLPPSRNLPNILPQFKPNSRYGPQFLSGQGLPPKFYHRGPPPPSQRNVYLQRDRPNNVPQIPGIERKRLDIRIPLDDIQIHYQAPLPSQQVVPPVRSNDQLFIDEESGLYKQPPKILNLKPKDEIKTLQMLKNFENATEKPLKDLPQKDMASNPLYIVYPAASKLTTTTEAEITSAVIKSSTLKTGAGADHHKPIFDVYAPNVFAIKKPQSPSFDANYYINNKNYYPQQQTKAPTVELEAPFFPSRTLETTNKEQWKALSRDGNGDGDKFQDRSDDVSKLNNNNENTTEKVLNMENFNPQFESGFQPIFPNSNDRQ